MPSLGVNIAILLDGGILLTKREDFEVWCLPVGDVDRHESVAQAAIREAREETGLEVDLTRLVGIYSFPSGPRDGSHIILFAGKPVGGSLSPSGEEVLEMGYFRPEEIPSPLLFGVDQEIKDALGGTAGIVWTYNADMPFDSSMTRQEIYSLRDQSGLGRKDFYLQYFKSLVAGKFMLDLGRDPFLTNNAPRPNERVINSQD